MYVWPVCTYVCLFVCNVWYACTILLRNIGYVIRYVPMLCLNDVGTYAPSDDVFVRQ
jgi:hypothetical protein